MTIEKQSGDGGTPESNQGNNSRANMRRRAAIDEKLGLDPNNKVQMRQTANQEWLVKLKQAIAEVDAEISAGNPEPKA